MLKSSLNFKSLAGVFFALFVLSACGGGGGGGAAAAAAPEPVVCGDNEFNDNGTCVAAINPSSCSDTQLVVNNVCTAYTAETCTEFFNSGNGKCEPVNNGSTCTSNQLVVDNVCAAYTSGTCGNDGKYWNTTDSTCVAVNDGSTCTANQLVEANVCTDYTSGTCNTAGKYWDSGTCVAIMTCTAQQNYVATDNTCPFNPEIFTDYAKVVFNANSAEYMANPNLAQINANTAYLAGYTGLGQTISTYIITTLDDATAGQKVGYNSTYDGLQDITTANPGAQSNNRTPLDTSDDFNVTNVSNPLFVAGVAANLVDTTGTETILNESLNIGSCESLSGAAITTCQGYAETMRNNHNLNLLAGRRDGIKGIHGVAYDAQIKVISNNNGKNVTDAQISAAITAGGSADIAAMTLNSTDSTNLRFLDTNGDGVINNSDNRFINPLTALDNAHKAAWQAVAATTVIVSDTGNNGFNSVTDAKIYASTPIDDAENVIAIYEDAYKNKWLTDNSGMTEADYNLSTDKTQHEKDALKNVNRAAYQDSIISPEFEGSWIVATGVVSGALAESDATNPGWSYDVYDQNGCGAAARYCLAVPRQLTKDNADANQVSEVQYTLAGAIAVIREAFPTLSVKQTVAVTLGTATYIDANGDGDDTNDVDYGLVDDNTGKYNAVYGHGLLDLGAAVSLTEGQETNANIISSSASPIGAIWGDTKLTLSHLFGTELSSVNLGVQDGYGRHFVLDAQNTSRAAVSNSSFDDYMANMLGDASQSQKLGTQTRLNYSNANQTWMDLQYKAGKATTSIAFQDSYKIKPLHDNSASTILRANNIRPASNNIGMMDIDYALNSNLTLSSYAARGEYDTGYKFDELGTDFDVNYKKSHLNIAIGNIREHDQFLGTNTTGAYALNAPTVSRFTDVTYGHDLGGKFNIYANYINYETDVDMLHDQFASIDGLQADQYQIGFTGKDLISKDDSLNVALITKLGVTDGALNQNTVLGYTADGGYNNVNQSYDLTVDERHQQFEITYQGKLYQNADKISALRENRFFTSIKVDSNLNHVQGASQVEVISGINIRY